MNQIKTPAKPAGYENTNIALHLFTPAEAQALLETSENYRSLSKKQIQQYTRIHERGEFLPSMIVLDEDGNLMDGFHRLEMVLATGLPWWGQLVTGQPREMLGALDHGRIRRRDDAIRYHLGVKNARTIGAICGVLEHGPDVWKMRLHPMESVELTKRWRPIAQEVFDAARPQRRLATSVCISGFAVACRERPESRPRIVAAIRDCANMRFDDTNQPMHAYLNMILQRPQTGSGSDRMTSYLKAARTALAIIAGEKLISIRAPATDPFAPHPGETT